MRNETNCKNQLTTYVLYYNKIAMRNEIRREFRSSLSLSLFFFFFFPVPFPRIIIRVYDVRSRRATSMFLDTEGKLSVAPSLPPPPPDNRN